MLDKKLTVLVAEDDKTSFVYLETILSKVGFNLINTENGEDTIQALKSNAEIAIILMDIKMPGMNGLEATRQIRSFNKSIPIIAQTAHAFIEDRDKAINAGCNDYVTKPIDRDLIIKLIRAYTNT
ncbi:MAG: response regulator [Bacteroidota bacterium]|jgi:two-component system, cell cycle response regulator DivK